MTSKNRKPRVIVQCVADQYSSDDERIIEFSFPGTSGPAGGLLQLAYDADGKPYVQLYRVEGCDVRPHRRDSK